MSQKILTNRSKYLIAAIVLAKFFVFAFVLVACERYERTSRKQSESSLMEEGAPVTSQNAGIQGADVSHYQKTINWTKLDEDSNIEFVFIKATEGITYVDRKFKTNWKNAKKTKLICGAYHYFLPKISVRKQFENFRRTAPLKKKDFAPLLDVETAQGLNRTALNKRIKEWLKLAEAHYGMKPLIYTTQRFYNTYLKNRFDEYEFVIARYNTKPPYMLDGRKVKFWQYTDRGRLPGIPVNVDRQNYSGSKKDLMSYTLK
jgi:lysozyme